MNSYDWDDIIFNPTSEKAKFCVGKECYYSDVPVTCLEDANSGKGTNLGRLKGIEPDFKFPFIFAGDSHNPVSYACIILKKDDLEAKYAPFKSGIEFITEYEDSLRSNDDGDNRTPDYRIGILGGVWLKHEFSDCSGCEYYSVTEIRKEGLVIGRENEVTSWDKVLETYKFLDGTPCGKLNEEE